MVKYSDVELEIIRFNADDVIATSCVAPVGVEDDGGL